MKTICIDRTKCNGCGACRTMCSIKKTGAARPVEGRVRINHMAGVRLSYPVVCQHCAEPQCVAACLKSIIHKEKDRVTRQYEQCFACASCAVSCPIGAVVYDSGLDAYITCDHCGGHPICVDVCPTGAITYQEPDTASGSIRQGYVRHVW